MTKRCKSPPKTREAEISMTSEAKLLRERRRQLIVGNGLKAPTVFNHQIDSWACRHWTIDDWAHKFQSKKLKFRMGPIDNPADGPLWEHHCQYVEATVHQFLRRRTTGAGQPLTIDEELTTDVEVTREEPFRHFSCQTHWAYADYKYMAQLFPHQHAIHNSVDWSCFGLEGRGGRESSLWMGDVHSNTPTHFDTYGCNLVAQLIGSKRWVLFPPASTHCLYPTRIPYEESSVFSRVNVTRPNLHAHPRFKMTRPVVVTLNPGQVLYVPPKWWHFVQSTTDLTLSINSWIELESDGERRLEEAVTRTLVTDFALAHPMDDWLNPTEEWTDPETNLSYIERSLSQLSDGAEGLTAAAHGLKRRRLSSSDDQQPIDVCFGEADYFQPQDMSFEDYMQLVGPSHASQPAHSAVKRDVKDNFLDALLHPDVVTLVCNKILEFRT